SNRYGMIPQELRGANLINLARRYQEHELDDLFLLGFDALSIEVKKQVGCRKPGPFIPIDKRVVFDDPKKISRCEFKNIRVAIGQFLLGAKKSRFKHPLIANSCSSTVKAELLSMQCLQKIARMEVDHLASAR